MPLTKREQFGFSLKNLQAEAKGDCMELLCCTSEQERRRKNSRGYRKERYGLTVSAKIFRRGAHCI